MSPDAIKIISRLAFAVILIAILMVPCVVDQNSSFCLAKGRKPRGKPAMPMPPMYNEAVQACTAGKYKDALDKLDVLDRTGWCCDKVHYYMGLCYHNLNQLQAAEQHYSIVYNFSKDPVLKYNAQVGYEQAAKYAANRTYAGQGNFFAKIASNGGFRRGGGGGG